MAKRKSNITSNFLIGLFIISATIIAIFAIIWLGASKFFVERNFYVTYFDGSVEGLEKGSPVKYLGVEVGTVSSIGVAPDGRLIEVVFQIDKKIEVTDDLRVKPEIMGISGRKFLQLHFPSDRKIARMYPELTFKPEYKYIKSSPSGLEEIEIAMREVIYNFKQIEMSKISDEIIEFLSSTSAFFRNPDIYATIENFRNSSLHIKNLIESADTTQILEYLTKSSQNVLKITNELQEFTKELNRQIIGMKLDEQTEKIIAGYDSTMWQVRNTINNLNYRTEIAIINFNDALQKLNETNAQLKRTLSTLKESPNLILSEPPPPER